MRDLIAGVALLGSLAAFGASVIAMFKPLPRLGMPTRRRALAGIGVAFALFVMTAIVIPAPSPDLANASAGRRPAPEAGTVRAADPQIAEVQAYLATRHASIKVNLDQMWSDGDLTKHAALVLKAAGQAIKNEASDLPASIETVNFWFTAPLIDGHGKETRGKVLEFRMKTAELKLVEYGKIAPEGLLEFADDIEVRVPAREGINTYCRQNRPTSPLFCTKAGG
ncbi:hypothetical protein FHS51_001722 [Sphingobium wenxiniae]|uniref:Uncharacterized protein n=1 Tax=Sphingobium wenxiniae (strain DSM 21828 / CGMCC 1.7748 / JZ-1) TaxID=595605 RepID=A0A562KDC4_SPHWJ|nr:hypothetical protein [Sphingobium wenxiniae]MBB6191495.1 hypothetical protein [Sphingobium wenxiniae]TWH93215.1 hypothetical protein IQ35_02122 [Sphingobium wenxiniae]